MATKCIISESREIILKQSVLILNKYRKINSFSSLAYKNKVRAKSFHFLWRRRPQNNFLHCVLIVKCITKTGCRRDSDFLFFPKQSWISIINVTCSTSYINIYAVDALQFWLTVSLCSSLCLVGFLISPNVQLTRSLIARSTIDIHILCFHQIALSIPNCSSQ